MLVIIVVAVLAGAIFIITRSQPAADKNKAANIAPAVVAQTTFKDRTETISGLLAQKFSWPVDKLTATIAREDGNFMNGIVTLYENSDQTVKINDQDAVMPKINTEGLFLAFKNGNNWQIAWAGPGNYDCQIAEQYQFPAAMVPDCQK